MSADLVQPQILERFQRLINSERLAHAYLFAGPAQTGKMATALALAQMVNCLEPGAPCGDCASCHKIAGGNHPDVHIIGNSDEDAIKIDEVRQMLAQVGLRAYEAQTKVFILHEAQRMTTEAANALLKTLEEPAGHTLIILTSAVAESCLATIKSRCHIVKFFAQEDRLPQDKDRILDVFLSRGNEDFLKTLSTDRAMTADAMRVLLSWVRDVLLYKNGVESSHLIYQNRIKDLEKMSRRSVQDLCALNHQIVRVKALSDENLNVKMALSLMKERLWGN